MINMLLISANYSSKTGLTILTLDYFFMKKKWMELKDEHESMRVNFLDRKPSLSLFSSQLWCWTHLRYRESITVKNAKIK